MAKAARGTVDGIEAMTRCSDAETLADAIMVLQQLDASGLNRRWRSLVGGPMPKDFGRPLTLRLLAYKLQAQRLGDLDKVSQRELAAFDAAPKERCVSNGELRAVKQSAENALKADVPKRDLGVALRRFARPGTVLAREHGGVMHRVMILDEGVSWNGKTYDSLTKVALAITGTRWNGPRFFGLRGKESTDLQPPKSLGPDLIIGRGRVGPSGRSLSQRATS